jgi:tripartite-type tricarboxylate transporter receptor subunit TctC
MLNFPIDGRKRKDKYFERRYTMKCARDHRVVVLREGKRLAVFVICMSMLLLSAGILSAADYPERQITFIVPFEPGGGTDVIARYVANGMKDILGQPVAVVNRAGAGGQVGTRALANSKADGYTIGTASNSMILQKYVAPNHVDRTEVEAIALINTDPGAFSVKSDAPWKTLQEALVWAKESPGQLSVGNGGTGAIFHICAALLEKKVSVKFNHVPFKGSNPAALAVAGGHTMATSISPAELKFMVEAGKVRILAIASEKRDPTFPAVPTYKESGVDLVAGVWRGIIAPKNTPKPIIAKLESAISKIVSSPGYREFLLKGGYGWDFQGAEKFAATMARNDEDYSKVVPELGIK